MCGIAGVLSSRHTGTQEDLAAVATRMGDRLAHRGPDSSGTWVDAAAGLALAHRRLAVIDPSPDGAQPMVSASRRFVTAFNGEIYNYAALRAELLALGHPFRSHCDTEVLLEAIEQWGIVGALERANGMFALAVWDRRERALHLARDRMGEKPLYYGWLAGSFLFGSELKALRAFPGCAPEIDRDALTLLVRHGYIAAPHCIYVGVKKLEPGRLLTVSPSNPGEERLSSYWSAYDVRVSAAENPFTGTDDEAIGELDRVLRDAVKIRMYADVSLGAFLSGGIDSSAIVALMQAQSSQPVKTFTIGFREDGYDEAQHAVRVAQHLGTDHTELYVSANDALGVIPRLAAMYDEPFADPSQIPTYLVNALARRHVTVALSGDGGDELFWGYQVYPVASRIRKVLRWIPPAARVWAGKSLAAVPARAWNLAERGLEPLLPRRRRNLVRHVRALCDVLADSRSDPMLYRSIMSQWRRPTSVVRGAQDPPTAFAECVSNPPVEGFSDMMMFLDAVTYLPDDILVKVDRASMAVSLESRIPLLDPRVVELAWRLPMRFKRRDGVSKWVLRQILYRHVPRDLVDRPKMGFGVPIDEWLRGPLREWAEDLLSEDALRREGYLDPVPVRRLLAEHLSRSRRGLQSKLWNVLMFQAWLREWRPS